MNPENKQMLLDLSKNLIKEKANEIISETEKITLIMSEEDLSIIVENLDTKLEELQHKINQLKNSAND